ncbi:hypothetical protein BC835DRAFT_1310738 [Cytidiella melzeri]|nr:hypothetical protein BC835DRAFT_1310738 [Cytidiella melzeri]
MSEARDGHHNYSRGQRLDTAGRGKEHSTNHNMGVKDLWKLINPAANREHSLSDIAVAGGFLARPDRTYRLGIDASIWLAQVRNTFLHRHSRYGHSPELRTLFFCIMKLLNASVAVVFVFDSARWPAVKRGVNITSRSDWLEEDFLKIITACGFDIHRAPGKAEAELASMSDVFVFGAAAVICSKYSDSLTGKTIEYYSENSLETCTQSGSRARRCGIATAYGLAGYGLTEDLRNSVACLQGADLATFLDVWRVNLWRCLAEDYNGLIGRCHRTLAATVPDTFPNLEVVHLYTNPIVSDLSPFTHVAKFRLPDIPSITQICELNFMWCSNACISDRFRSNLWPGVVMRLLVNEVLCCDGSRNDKTFSDMLTFEVCSTQSNSDVTLRMSAGIIEEVICKAVLTIWDPLRNTGGSRVLQKLDEATLNLSLTKVVYRNKSRLLKVPAAVLLHACPQCGPNLTALNMEQHEQHIRHSGCLEPAENGHAGSSSSLLLPHGCRDVPHLPSNCRYCCGEVIDLTENVPHHEIIDLTLDN